MARAILEELSRRMAAMVKRVGGRRILVAGGVADGQSGGDSVAGTRDEITRTEADPLLGAARMASRQLTEQRLFASDWKVWFRPQRMAVLAQHFQSSGGALAKRTG